MTDYWIMFLKDPATGEIDGTLVRHNATADYREHNPYFIGSTRIQIDMEDLQK